MTDIIIAGTIERERGYLDYMRRVYDPNGVCPTLLSGNGGNKTIKIIEGVKKC